MSWSSFFFRPKEREDDRPPGAKYKCQDRTSYIGPGQDNPKQPLVPDHKARTKYVDLTLEPNGDVTAPRLRDRSLGARLELRKRLMKRRRWLVNVEFMMAMLGIMLMVVENELYYANKLTEKDSAVSFVLKLFITITTVILLIAICLYYQAGIELRMFDGRVDDPFAVTPLYTWLTLVVELTVCAVHPFPGNVWRPDPSISCLDNVKTLQVSIPKWITCSKCSAASEPTMRGSIDGILSVLMMLRLYLVGKFIVVHSSILTDPTTQNVSAVSHVKININFVLKAALNNHPAEVITLMILTMYLVSVWSMRTCELYYTDMPENQSVSEAMWLSAITFLTVGYGDLTPKTHCGRFIAVSTALMGLCSTALLVAVIARKLEQTHSERYVYNFLTRVHLRNKFKAAAADVVKHTLKICSMRKRGKLPVSSLDRTVLQWRLRSAIRTIRASRAAQAEIEEASVGLSEVCQMISTLEKRAKDSQNTQKEILEKMDALQSQMAAFMRNRDGADQGKT
ncbi:hypothetical protein BaRGS_00008455 [Batillaria attramentaria]|uniref:Potassium channel domain-containing protein n=1 Tax=Batillaria attramentaria TaxID=370345 RepID=A0ABD0LMI7_9CAEN